MSTAHPVRASRVSFSANNPTIRACKATERRGSKREEHVFRIALSLNNLRSTSMRSVLHRLCEFWDTDGNGKIYPWDIFIGFRKLGFNVVLCIWAAVTMAICSSYVTQTSWLPHPLFAININNIHRNRYGSTTTIYDRNANIDIR